MDKTRNDVLNIVTKTLDSNKTVRDTKESHRLLINILINTLTAREFITLILRNSGMSCKQAGCVMGVYCGRASQLEQKAYRKLRHPKRSRLLKQLINEKETKQEMMERRLNRWKAKNRHHSLLSNCNKCGDTHPLQNLLISNEELVCGKCHNENLKNV